MVLTVSSMVQAFNDARAGKFEDEVLAHLDRLQIPSHFAALRVLCWSMVGAHSQESILALAGSG